MMTRRLLHAALARTTRTRPAITLLVKLASIAVHAEEFLSADGHAFDLSALRALLSDTEVRAFLDDKANAALLPIKRMARPPLTRSRQTAVQNDGRE